MLGKMKNSEASWGILSTIYPEIMSKIEVITAKGIGVKSNLKMDKALAINSDEAIQINEKFTHI